MRVVVVGSREARVVGEVVVWGKELGGIFTHLVLDQHHCNIIINGNKAF